MSTILITGGTGLLGSELTRMLLKKGHEVIVLSRHEKTSRQPGLRYAVWNVEGQTIDKSAIAAADYVVHLAGANVAGERWTDSRKKEIVESRTNSSALLVKAINESDNHIKAVISASAIGWYGADEKRSPRKKAFTEDMPADSGFLGKTCLLWEQSIEPVENLGKRLVKIRIGIVLSNNGGALPEFKKPVKFGIAAVLGSGKQIISWIHIDDVCRLFMYAMENETMRGVYNGVAPMPVRNKELTLKLAERLKGKFFVHLHVPAFVLKLVLGEMSEEVLKSATVSDEKVRAAGFSFGYPTIDSALAELIST